MDEPLTVLHVAGAGRSGSTLLGGLLGQLDGFFNTGELGYLWDRGLAQGGVCGCGEPVRGCPVWKAVLADALDGAGPETLDELRRRHAATIRGRHVQALHLTGRLPRRADREIGDYPRRLERVYRSIARATGCRVIVDTTKPVTYGHLLGRIPSVDLRVVHLVRDPRAVAWSWLRAKGGDGADTMATRSAMTSALLWRAGNGAASRLWAGAADRYLVVRYEDLVRDPARRLGEIARLAGVPGVPLPLVDDRTVLLAATHTVAGNVDRHRTGRVELRLDDQWSRAMPAGRRRLVETATYPMRLRYGYRLGV